MRCPYLAAIVATATWMSLGLQPALAQDDATKARAKEAFQAGVAAHEAARYQEALAHFEEAQRLKPHPLVQVNIANCHDKLDHPVEAIFHYERFLDSGQAKPEQRKEVADALKRLRGMVGRLLLSVTPDGASVVIDGGPARRAPIEEPIPLKAGAHRIEVRRDGYDPAAREFDVKGGGVLEIAVQLEASKAAPPVAPPVPRPAPAATTAPSEPPPEAAPPPAPAPAPARPPAAAEAPADASGDGLSTRVWVAGGVTAALAVAATVTGLLALDAEADFEAQRNIRFSMDPDLPAGDRVAAYYAALDAADRADALAITTDVLIGLAVVGAGVTTVFVLLDGDDTESASLRPVVAPGTAGLVVHTRY